MTNVMPEDQFEPSEIPSMTQDAANPEDGSAQAVSCPKHCPTSMWVRGFAASLVLIGAAGYGAISVKPELAEYIPLGGKPPGYSCPLSGGAASSCTAGSSCGAASSCGVDNLSSCPCPTSELVDEQVLAPAEVVDVATPPSDLPEVSSDPLSTSPDEI